MDQHDTTASPPPTPARGRRRLVLPAVGAALALATAGTGIGYAAAQTPIGDARTDPGLHLPQCCRPATATPRATRTTSASGCGRGDHLGRHHQPGVG